MNAQLRACAFVVLTAAAAGCDSGAMTPLHEAVVRGDAAAVQAWIARKGNLEVTIDEPSSGLEGNSGRLLGITPLLLAARIGRFDMVQLLVEGGANIYAEARPRDERPDWSYRRTAFDFAFEYTMERGGGAQTLAYLWKKSDGARFASRLDRQISYACSRYCNDKTGGDAQSNPALLLIGVAPDPFLGRGVSDAACSSQQPLELLAFLDKHKVRFPKNTLHCAAYGQSASSRSLDERIDIATFFLDHGADIEDLGISGYSTPLMGAAAAHQLEMVKFLLARGANPNTRNSVGFNSAISAANNCAYGGTDAQVEPKQKPQLATIEYLVQAGAETKLPASAQARGGLLLNECCSRKPHSPTQRRICEVFGL
jgi:hypothetical protein